MFYFQYTAQQEGSTWLDTALVLSSAFFTFLGTIKIFYILIFYDNETLAEVGIFSSDKSHDTSINYACIYFAHFSYTHVALNFFSCAASLFLQTEYLVWGGEVTCTHIYTHAQDPDLDEWKGYVQDPDAGYVLVWTVTPHLYSKLRKQLHYLMSWSSP